MSLNQQQIQELMALRRWFLPKMGKLLKDRQRISRALQDSQVNGIHQVHSHTQPITTLSGPSLMCSVKDRPKISTQVYTSLRLVATGSMQAGSLQLAAQVPAEVLSGKVLHPAQLSTPPAEKTAHDVVKSRSSSCDVLLLENTAEKAQGIIMPADILQHSSYDCTRRCLDRCASKLQPLLWVNSGHCWGGLGPRAAWGPVH